jgi:hypothetical protein
VLGKLLHRRKAEEAVNPIQAIKQKHIIVVTSFSLRAPNLLLLLLLLLLVSTILSPQIHSITNPFPFILHPITSLFTLSLQFILLSPLYKFLVNFFHLSTSTNYYHFLILQVFNQQWSFSNKVSKFTSFLYFNFFPLLGS